MILSDIMEARLAAEEKELYAEQRRKAGIKEGRQEEKEQVIVNMYKDHLSLDIIAKYVNLSIDKVKAIINKIKK